MIVLQSSSCCWLSLPDLLPNLISEDFVPIDLGASDRQLAPQSFKCRRRHRVVVVADGVLRKRGEVRKKRKHQLQTMRVPLAPNNRNKFDVCDDTVDTTRTGLT